MNLQAYESAVQGEPSLKFKSEKFYNPDILF